MPSTTLAQVYTFQLNTNWLWAIFFTGLTFLVVGKVALLVAEQRNRAKRPEALPAGRHRTATSRDQAKRQLVERSMKVMLSRPHRSYAPGAAAVPDYVLAETQKIERVEA